MNATRSRVLATLVLAVAGPAQEPPAGPALQSVQTIQELSRSAGQRLQSGVEELTRLRDQIAAEKLPLAQQLTALEEKVAQQRRDNDEAARRLDAGNLELAGLEAEMKARRDELTYVGNLLDEYAHTFESKLNVGERQRCGAAIERAEQAPANPALSLADKLARQAEVVNLSLQRLFDALGGMRFAGAGVDLQGTVVDGQFAMIGPVALFRGENGAAGLAVPQAGSPQPLIRPLDGELQAGIDRLVQQGEGTLPLDPSLGGALKALVQRTNIVHVFVKGGPIMWPLLFASVLALGTVLERLLFLWNERRKRNPAAMDALFAALERGDAGEALRIGRASRDYVLRVLGYALEHREKSLPNALVYAQGRELKRFRRGIAILDTVITLAPLLGLLGTVTGMMRSFSLIGGELSAPGAITGGIAEALIATAFGLGIAITALLPFNFLNARLEEAQNEIQSAATQLELVVHPQGGAPPHALDVSEPTTSIAMTKE